MQGPCQTEEIPKVADSVGRELVQALEHRGDAVVRAVEVARIDSLLHTYIPISRLSSCARLLVHFLHGQVFGDLKAR